MRHWLRFVCIGLILGSVTEAEFKLVAGINPSAFIVTLFAYPIILTLSYLGHRGVNRRLRSVWRGDVLHYAASGLGGLVIEWTLLGNPPGSNAFQLGMFAMWTTFCFGPRVLTREAPLLQAARHRFWLAFGAVTAALTAIIALAPSREAKVVLAVLGLSGANVVWSVWLLAMAWRSRRASSGQQRWARPIFCLESIPRAFPAGWSEAWCRSAFSRFSPSIFPPCRVRPSRVCRARRAPIP